MEVIRPEVPMVSMTFSTAMTGCHRVGIPTLHQSSTSGMFVIHTWHSFRFRQPRPRWVFLVAGGVFGDPQTFGDSSVTSHGNVHPFPTIRVTNMRHMDVIPIAFAFAFGQNIGRPVTFL